MCSTGIRAVELYWDTNGATPGSGNVGGSWAGTTWTTDANGLIATTGWLDGSDAVFSAGTDGTGAWTVDVGATGRSVRHVIVQEGAVTLGTSGSFSLSDAANWSVAVGSSLTVTRAIANNGHDLSFFSGTNNGGAVTVGGVISGTGSLSVTGPGILTLSAENTYEGPTIIDGGTLKLGHQFGIGKIIYSGTNAQAKGFTLRSGTFDVNGQVTYTPINGPGNWLLLTPIILAGRAGEELTITGTGGGFGLFKYGANEAKIIYDATDNPGTATISAPFSTSGYGSGTHTRYIVVGDSTNTDIELDFTGTLGQTAATDGQTTTIRKEGAGTMQISAANYFPCLHVAGGVLIANHDQALGVSRTATGGLPNLLTLQNGTLQAGGADRAFSTPIALVGSGTISGNDVNLTLSGNITGAGSLVKSGTKNVSLSGTNSYTGNTAINQGMLSIATTASLPGWNTIGRYSVADGTTLSVGNGVLETQVTTMLGTGNFTSGSRLGFDTTAGDRTHAASISGSIGLTKLGSGTLTLSGSSSYTGETVILEGTLKLGHQFGVGSVGGHAKGFTLTNGTFDINGQSTYMGSWLLLSPITLAGDAGAELNVVGTGGGFGLHNNMAGNEGRIIYDATNNPGTATISAAFSTSGSSGDVRRYIVVGDSAATAVEVDFTGTLGQTGVSDGRHSTIQKEGSGTMRISAANYFPRIEVAGGVLIGNHDQALGISRLGDSGAPNRVTLAGGTLQAGGADRSYSAEVLLTAHSTISGDDANLTLSGRITGADMNLLKAGTKTLTLSATNNAYGNTTISEGVLAITNAGALPGWNTTGRYSVADGATLGVGTGVTEAQVTTMLGTSNFQAGSRLGFDTTAGDRTHTASISGPIGVTKLGIGMLTLSGNNSYEGTTIIDGGTLKLGHKFGIGTNSYVYNNITYYRAKGFTLREGAFDFNGMYDFTISGLNTLLVLDTITLGGKAGAEMTIADSTGGGGFGLFAAGGYEGRIVYDATNNPGTATISARLSASGTGGSATRSIVVGDSSATDIELDFTGILGQNVHTDGQRTTIRKEGAGAMRISAANFFPRLHVAGGVLIANHHQALGVSRIDTNLLTLQGGTLQAGGADRAFNTPITLVGSGTISGNDWNLTLSGVIDGSGNLIKDGSKRLTLSGANIYTGTTTINGGTLQVGDGGDAGQLGTGNVINDAALIVDRSGQLSLNQIISGSGTLTKTGSGLLVLGGNNSNYTGETTILEGTLQLDHPFAIGMAGSHAKGFTLRNGTFDINGQITYAGSWLVLGPITLGGQAGSETTIAGTGGGFGLHDVGGNVGKIIYDATNDPGTATISAPFSTSGASGTATRYIVVGDSSATDVELDFTGTLGQTGVSDGLNTTIRKEGDGTTRISAANYFPRLHVAGGVLIANHDQALGVTRPGGSTNLLTLQNSALQAGGADRSFDTPITLVGSGTFSGDDWNMTLGGAIGGSGNLVKSGANALTLSAFDNDYAGTTTVQAGLLNVTGLLANNGAADILIQSAGTAFGSNDPRIARYAPGGLDLSGTSVGSSVIGGDYGTTAELLAGIAGADRTVTMAWRQGTVDEKTLDGGGLISDVLNLEGTGSDTYVLQMSYSPDALAAVWHEGTLAESISLAWLDNGVWKNAVAGNMGGTPTFFEIAYDSEEHFTLGYHGVDTLNHAAWAVLNHNSQFAVIVPEPGALGLLAAGLLGLLACGRRKGTFRF